MQEINQNLWIAFWNEIEKEIESQLGQKFNTIVYGIFYGMSSIYHEP